MLRSELVAQLSALDVFMASAAFPLVQANFDLDVKNHELSILNTPPVRVEDIAAANQLFGKREVAIALTTHFEDLRNALVSQIARMDESGTIVAATQTDTE